MYDIVYSHLVVHRLFYKDLARYIISFIGEEDDDGADDMPLTYIPKGMYNRLRHSKYKDYLYNITNRLEHKKR